MTRVDSESDQAFSAGAEVTRSEGSRSLDLIDTDLADARDALDGAEKRASRHLVWAALGLSPAALIPFLGFLAEGSFNLIGPLIVLVFLVEGGRYLLARRDAKRLHAVWQEIAAERREVFMNDLEEEV